MSYLGSIDENNMSVNMHINPFKFDMIWESKNGLHKSECLQMKYCDQTLYL